MTSTSRAAVAALAVMLTATPLLAATPVADPAPKPQRATGTLISVDPARRIVVVRPDGEGAGEITLHLAPAARVARGRRAVDLGALGPGQRVRVTHTRIDGRDVATRIGILVPPSRRAP